MSTTNATVHFYRNNKYEKAFKNVLSQNMNSEVNSSILRMKHSL